MLCSYEASCTQNRQNGDCPDRCGRWLNGMMILVGVIAGLVFAAAVVLLFLGSFLPAVFPAILTVLITGMVTLLTVTIAALVLPEQSRGKRCLHCHLGGLFFGLFGLIISSLLAISTDLAVGTVIAAVTIGLTAFFAAFLLTSLLFVVHCGVKG